MTTEQLYPASLDAHRGLIANEELAPAVLLVSGEEHLPMHKRRMEGIQFLGGRATYTELGRQHIQDEEGRPMRAAASLALSGLGDEQIASILQVDPSAVRSKLLLPTYNLTYGRTKDRKRSPGRIGLMNGMLHRSAGAFAKISQPADRRYFEGLDLDDQQEAVWQLTARGMHRTIIAKSVYPSRTSEAKSNDAAVKVARQVIREQLGINTNTCKQERSKVVLLAIAYYLRPLELDPQQGDQTR